MFGKLFNGLRALFGFVRGRLFAWESLPEPPAADGQPTANNQGSKHFVGWLLGREELPQQPSPDGAAHEGRARNLWGFLFAQDGALPPPLAQQPVKEKSLLSWLLAREPLGESSPSKHQKQEKP